VRREEEERWGSDPSYAPPRRSDGPGGPPPPPPPPRNRRGGGGDNVRKLFTPALVAAAFVVRPPHPIPERTHPIQPSAHSSTRGSGALGTLERSEAAMTGWSSTCGALRWIHPCGP
jgi:hypothetical protein